MRRLLCGRNGVGSATSGGLSSSRFELADGGAADRLPAASGASPDRPAGPAEGQRSGAGVIAGAWPLAKPLQIGPGVIRAGCHTAGQGLDEHVLGGCLELAAE
jgi:hypothetical protein